MSYSVKRVLMYSLCPRAQISQFCTYFSEKLSSDKHTDFSAKSIMEVQVKILYGWIFLTTPYVFLKFSRMNTGIDEELTLTVRNDSLLDNTRAILRAHSSSRRFPLMSTTSIVWLVSKASMMAQPPSLPNPFHDKLHSLIRTFSYKKKL